MQARIGPFGKLGCSYSKKNDVRRKMADSLPVLGWADTKLSTSVTDNLQASSRPFDCAV